MKVKDEDFKKAKENVLYRKNEGTPEGLYLQDKNMILSFIIFTKIQNKRLFTRWAYLQVSVAQLLDTGHAFKLFNQQNRKQM